MEKGSIQWMLYWLFQNNWPTGLTFILIIIGFIFTVLVMAV